MNEMLRSHVTPSPITTAYAQDGFYFPYDVVTEQEAAALLADLEAGEAEVAANREDLSLLRSYPARLLPSFDADRTLDAFAAVDRAAQALDRNASPKIVADWLAFQV